MQAKEAAARAAVLLVKDGMCVGLGTGSTAWFAVEALAERVRLEGIRVQVIATSEVTTAQAKSHNIPFTNFSQNPILDITIDGADEVDPAGCLIKGAGGALLREKIVASSSKQMVVICDSSKMKTTLGAHPLPVAIVPFAYESTLHRLERHCRNLTLRTTGLGTPVITDDGLFLTDMQMGVIENPARTESELRAIVGVVEVGLFVGVASRIIVGFDDGHTEEHAV